MLPIHQVSADETDILTQGAKLLNDGLGSGTYDLEHLRQWCADGVLFAAVDPEKNTVAAIMNARVLGPVLESPFDEYSDRGPVGFLRSLVVHPDYRGHGLGTRLTAYIIQWLTDHGAKVFVGLSWDSHSPQSSLKMLLSMGFKVDRVIKAYWHDISLKENFGCPVCGPPPCKCDAFLCSRQGDEYFGPTR